MKYDSTTSKLMIVGIIGLVCVGLSTLVLGLVQEREASRAEAIKTNEGPKTAMGSATSGVITDLEISDYRKIVRSIKYAILFFVVTFATLFFSEIVYGLRLHPLQYFLVGAALALFYLLLLSLAEYIGFRYAYFLSTGMIVSLVAGYSRSILKSDWRAASIGGLLILIYGYLYFVLSLEQYALLSGSLLVFASLATIMFLTRNIDWFEYSTINNKSQIDSL
jgi:inner membrane protein involved in colicin E2 resistance